MERSKICLCLNGKTIKEDLQLVNQYRNYIDLVELRADYLDDDEKLSLRRFPELAGLPCILTIRRKCDGGTYIDGEAERTTLFAMALAYADEDSAKNFAYIDMESDYNVPSIQDAATAFGTRIIRSYHKFDGPIDDLNVEMKKLRRTGYEIPKVAFMPNSLSDVSRIMKQSAAIKDFEHIVLAMGPLGQPSRILATKFNSFLTFTCPETGDGKLFELGQIDPITLSEVYNFANINNYTSIYGVTGYPLKVTGSPALHNAGYKNHGMNSVYIPVRSQEISDVVKFAEAIGIKGLSVTVPFKNKVIPLLTNKSSVVEKIQASNTIVCNDGEWSGSNTDVYGFKRSFLEFLGTKHLKGKKVAIIGAGGAAKAIAYVIKELGCKACVFNRTLSNAKNLADEFGFKYASLSMESLNLLEKYSDIIVQTSSVGLGVPDSEESNEKNDPIYFYDFRGTEKIYDVIYEPEKTPVLKRAEKAGCKVCNGADMLKYQGYEQFEIFTGEKY